MKIKHAIGNFAILNDLVYLDKKSSGFFNPTRSKRIKNKLNRKYYKLK